MKLGPYALLSEVIREDLGLKGTKRGCDFGGCGACTVLMDGHPIYSCMMPAREIEGHEITTIEGLEKDGRLHPVQQAFLDEGVMQCGYCTSGMIMTAVGLLKVHPDPTEQEISHFMQGNICRCGTYRRIIAAIRRAARRPQAALAPQ